MDKNAEGRYWPGRASAILHVQSSDLISPILQLTVSGYETPPRDDARAGEDDDVFVVLDEAAGLVDGGHGAFRCGTGFEGAIW